MKDLAEKLVKRMAEIQEQKREAEEIHLHHVNRALDLIDQSLEEANHKRDSTDSNPHIYFNTISK